MNRHLSGMGWTAVAWAALAVVVLTGCGKKVSNCISGETPYEVAASLGLGWNSGTSWMRSVTEWRKKPPGAMIP